ncbi:MAG: septum formation inhibitor-activating ATPase [Microcella pacifica]|uniref:Septum formation inhibitor-activating ATPase n=1 Tax=Microcella pacifica TaxID=2591847 RepID=A0A9E5JLJ8_9MICO|nr:septum formation inhibitor-activating ATPase [Microcella pacifica]NHF62843.1 septum formation inhibitor-activating ATPase [Microcella pacifica]
MRIALAVPGLDADTLELALLRAGHRVVWRALDTDEVVGQLAEATPEVLLLADHPDVATSTVVGASDLLGVRSVLVTTGSALSAAARRLGVLEQLVARPGAPIDLAALEAGPLGATSHTAVPDGTGLSGDLSDGPGLLDGPGLRDEAGLPDGVGLSDDAAEHDDARPPSPQPSSPPTSTPVSPHTPPSRSRGSAARGDTIARLEIDPSSVAPRVIAVWGPAGAPGRTTIAIGLAAELAGRGLPVCLVDADTYGGAIAPALGLLDESPGFAAACRLAGSGSLTADELDRVAQRAPLGSTLRGTHGELRVLTGIGRPHRWPELSAERVTSVLEECRAWRPIVVVDTGFNLETDEELSSDLLAPRRNAATIAALRAADDVVAVGTADPLGLARLLRTYPDLLDVVLTTSVRVVVNRVRSSVLGLDPAGQVRQTLDRFGGVSDAVLIDDDPHAADAALLTARSVVDAAPRSALRAGIAELADVLEVTERPAPVRSRFVGGLAALLPGRSG